MIQGRVYYSGLREDDQTMNRMLLLICLLLAGAAGAEVDEPPSISPDELENYQFDEQPEPVQMTVEVLSFGQRFIMSQQRGEVEDLIARHVGIVRLHGDHTDLDAMQQLVEKQVVKEDVKSWQAMGVVMGDLMADEFDLHWVSVIDELGESKALQWQDTMDFVFPVTLLSKRKQFGEKIDIPAIYEKIRADVQAFKTN